MLGFYVQTTLKCYSLSGPSQTSIVSGRSGMLTKHLSKKKSTQSSSCSLAQRKHSAQFAFHSPPGRTFSRRQEHGRKSAHTATLSHASHFQPSGPRSCRAEVKLICHQFLELRGSSYTTISKEHLIIACRRQQGLRTKASPGGLTFSIHLSNFQKVCNCLMPTENSRVGSDSFCYGDLGFQSPRRWSFLKVNWQGICSSNQ